MSHVDAGVVGLGVVLVLAFGGAAWRAGSLRSDIVEKYQPRVGVAQAGLDVMARDGLQRLASNVATALGGLDDGFNPSEAIVDPTELRDLVNGIAAALEARERLPIYFRWMLGVGPKLVAFLTLVASSTLVAFSYLSGWLRTRDLAYVGLYGMLGFGICAVLTAGSYIVLLHRFSSAELLANKELG